ncbi:permease-like cell division protein FtsX [Candidatus Methylobacter oryzae]|uniref:Cell division protein FtsX n=1 Tax=Candidatus Methylobacter oryzae TaxID=2497749 RepID=A0ABY3CFB1_9GAMM|nr:permease-like cell division protein FtsX [Candidatus Methylobacter oryzae]TRW96464.1 FtsX-like permease family protein [Candidatus Methylobacter oryzae]
MMKHVVNKKVGKQEPRWQTKISGGNFVDKFHAYRNLHAHALFSSLGRLLASRFSFVMTIIVLAIAISLASGFYILVVNLQQLAGNLEASNQISLFLKDEISETRANKFVNSIKQNPDIQEVKLITKDEALAEFQAYSGFGDAVKALENNPLPLVVQVLPKNSLKEEQALEALLDDFKRSAEVDFAQMDMQWVKRLQSIMEVAERGVVLLSLLLGAGVLFITANTIRLEVHNRRDEVVIAKLVGATNGFIHRPFLYSGFWIGFFSGVAAWFIVTIIMLILKQPIEKLSGLYDDGFRVLFFGFTETLALLFISSVLGVVGSWIVLHFQLRQLKPE